MANVSQLKWKITKITVIIISNKMKYQNTSMNALSLWLLFLTEQFGQYFQHRGLLVTNVPIYHFATSSVFSNTYFNEPPSDQCRSSD